jgi:hypothetical protein
MARNSFSVSKANDAVWEDLQAKLVQSPALAPYIVARMAGLGNIRVGVPGILSGQVAGFGVRTGKTRREGLKAVFKNTKTGFFATLHTPLFNIFTTGTRRGIPALPLWEAFDSGFQASGIAEQVVDQALTDLDNNRIPDLQKYLTLGTRRRRR